MEPLTVDRITEGPILVTGGTGTLGQHVVAGLVSAGRRVRVLSRGKRANLDDHPMIEHLTADLSTGVLDGAALDGVEVVMHLAGSAKGDGDKAATIAWAAREAGTRHLIYISVVGADRVPVESWLDRAMFGYFASKLAAEHIVTESGVPWSILRATQFHDLTFATLHAMGKLPVIPVPSGLRFQPVDSADVSARLVELALGEPSGLVQDIGGPHIYEMADLARSYLRATRRHRPVVAFPLPGKAAAAMRAGANLTPGRAVGRGTWEEFLAEHAGAASVTPHLTDGQGLTR